MARLLTWMPCSFICSDPMVQRISKATVDSSDESEGRGSGLSDDAEVLGSVETSR